MDTFADFMTGLRTGRDPIYIVESEIKGEMLTRIRPSREKLKIKFLLLFTYSLKGPVNLRK